MVASILFAQKYEYKEPELGYQKKEPSSSKFLRINALEIKMGKMYQRMQALEERVQKLEAGAL